MKNISRRYIGGFTLVELLVVVLIIGILSAVAVPMYQGAVDKTQFSTMLSPTRSLKEAQEAVRMATGNYTTDTADLDVDLSQEALSYQIKTTANGDEFNVILATNDKLPNVRLARYLDENLLLHGQLHCEAKIGDERANKLCGPLLIGQELKATGDGYMAYLLDEEIDQPTCDYAGKSFSTSKTKCYKDTATRCDALGMPAIAGQDQCGYTNTGGQTVGEEGICNADSQHGCGNSTIENGGKCMVSSDSAGGGCGGSTIKNGGVCEHNANTIPGWGCGRLKIEEGGTCISSGYDGCAYSQVVGGAIICTKEGSGYCGLTSSFDQGGVCVGNGGNACYGASFKNGSICYANVSGSCGKYGPQSYDDLYDSTSCCCGAYCPNGAPKCAASRCDPQYMK